MTLGISRNVRMEGLVFVISCALALLIQGYWLATQPLWDATEWGNETGYVMDHDPRQFDGRLAYGHPGGTLIIGTELVHAVTGSSYYQSLLIFLALIDAALIALSALLAYLLWGSVLVSATIVIILAANELISWSTPPSLLAAYAFVALALATVLVMKNNLSRFGLLGWGVLLGATLATRFDVGIVALVLFGGALAYNVGVRRMVPTFLCALAALFLLDPFLWTDPVAHLSYALGKFLYHYSDYVSGTQLPLSFVLQTSFMGILGVLAAVAAFSRAPIPRVFIAALLIATTLAFVLFFTASYQAIRYLQPFLTLWEVLLPAYILAFVPGRRAAAVLLVLLAAYHVALYAIHVS